MTEACWQVEGGEVEGEGRHETGNPFPTDTAFTLSTFWYMMTNLYHQLKAQGKAKAGSDKNKRLQTVQEQDDCSRLSVSFIVPEGFQNWQCANMSIPMSIAGNWPSHYFFRVDLLCRCLADCVEKICQCFLTPVRATKRTSQYYVPVRVSVSLNDFII